MLLALQLRGCLGSAARVVVIRAPSPLLVHGWDRNKNLNAYSILALSTHKNVKYYPTMTKLKIQKNESIEITDGLGMPCMMGRGFKV